MAKTTKVDTIDTAAITALIERVEYSIEHNLALTIEDMKLLLLAITTLCTLQQKMEQDDITLYKLRKLLGMVKQSEQRRKRTGKNGQRSSHNKKNNKENRQARTKKQAPPQVIHHKLTDYHRGDTCPDCQRGKLYKYELGKLLRITGHAPFEATEHITEQLRCSACQKVYKASLPAEVLAGGSANQRYGYSARTLMVIYKFYSGLPYYHQGTLADIFHQSISASTVFDQCEQVSDAVMPVFYALRRLAANAKQFLLDDTHHRILDQQPELRDKRHGKGQRWRTGVYSSGLIAQLPEGNEIVLFETSLAHAGEHLDTLLKKRAPGLPPPLTMSDALTSNKATVATTRSAYCNAHARRQFFDLESLYPKDVEWVLETYSAIWQAEDEVREKGLTEQQRLTYHQEHSLPAMEKIKEWATRKRASPAFEEHSAMGKAIQYFLRHYDRLILFCVEPGALIDNNRMEEKLKLLIRGRKTSHFYKTAVGADVANVLLSLIATAYGASVNLFDYLLALQKNSEAVKANPETWLPWNYEATLMTVDKEQEDLQAA